MFTLIGAALIGGIFLSTLIAHALTHGRSRISRTILRAFAVRYAPEAVDARAEKRRARAGAR